MDKTLAEEIQNFFIIGSAVRPMWGAADRWFVIISGKLDDDEKTELESAFGQTFQFHSIGGNTAIYPNY